MRCSYKAPILAPYCMSAITITLLLCLMLHGFLSLLGTNATSNGSCASGSGVILRIQKTDGSIVKLRVPARHETNTTISSLMHTVLASSAKNSLSPFLQCTLGASSASAKPLDPSKTIADLGLKHGSLLCLRDVRGEKKSSSSALSEPMRRKARDSRGAKDAATLPFDPFPDIAKPRHSTVSRRARALANRRRGMTYGDIDRMTSSMHTIEVQDRGTVKRIYMCAQGAKNFQANCAARKKLKKTKKHSSEAKDRGKHGGERRCALLFGTVNKEREDLKPFVRTSLSTPDRNLCEVVKVHAVWEPPQTPRLLYDASKLIEFTSCPEVKRALDLAAKLNLQPVGWIFSYEAKEGDAREEAHVPILASDVIVAGKLQTKTMQHVGREKGGRFVTLALDTPSGTTEAFQISDRAVQMVAEGVLIDPAEQIKIGRQQPVSIGPSSADMRFLRSSDPVLVDGKETNDVDSVLCLINTAVLSHKGRLSGTNIVSSKGQITAKTRRLLIASLAGRGDKSIVELLCDFKLLYGLSKLMNTADVDGLCELVLKWSRGQRKGAELTKHLKLVIESLLAS